MASLKFEIVTAERVVYTDEVNMVIAPGVEGELGILPRHTPLMTTLKPGEVRLRKGNDEVCLFVSGGFMEVMPDKVVILADTAERADEIDIARANESRRRAEITIAEKVGEVDLVRAELALRRSLMRLKVAQRRRRGR
ncbi:MAG: F0F1 ATP synthase subunit epsilon [Dehalococcoidia bacterium]|nr:F0F1 ATP synthase subunit epsilon [Dehalococcoidia bacterium]